MDLQSCTSVLIVSNHITLTIMNEERFQVLDISIDGFTSVQRRHDDLSELEVELGCGALCTIDGMMKKLEKLVLRAAEPHQASEIISAIINLKGMQLLGSGLA